jgi:hypothetical protein
MNNILIHYLSYLFIFLILFEIVLQITIHFLKKDFQWLITKKDEFPISDQSQLDEFIKKKFSKHTGWKWRANTKGYEYLNNIRTSFKISKNGYRETGNIFNNSTISVIGDSYAFCRYVNDNETWVSFLEKKMNIGIRNYGVGNYGIDQAIIKYFNISVEKETQLIILAFVPETISRVHSFWKHYCEFGNKFAFKPKYTLVNGKLKLIPTVLQENSTIKTLIDKTNYIKQNDIFYEKKFLLHMYKFPYLVTYFKYLERYSVIIYNLLIYKIYNFFKIKNSTRFLNNAFGKIVSDNISDSYKMYNDAKYTELLRNLIYDFKEKLDKEGRKLVLLVLPQLNDIKNAKKKTISYQLFFEKIKKKVNIIDLTNSLKNLPDYKNYYLEDNHGGHFSSSGNKLVAELILNEIKKILR